MFYFEHESRKTNLQFISTMTEFVPIVHVYGGVSFFVFFKLCLSGSQTKLKIIPNRRLHVFRDVIKDTNNTHEELMEHVK